MAPNDGTFGAIEPFCLFVGGPLWQKKKKAATIFLAMF